MHRTERLVDDKKVNKMGVKCDKIIRKTYKNCQKQKKNCPVFLLASERKRLLAFYIADRDLIPWF